MKKERNWVFQGYSLPKDTIELVRKVSKETEIPMSKLVNRAILNAYGDKKKDEI